ncbi:MAG: hypothetical protein AEth_01326 [Candidatus Argoarchaeum ethanivorans]|uniref:Uncharacterized protein n=1 Tax=Candidatus Argoarchaeum ethanivorans TaxID=2608793 RepID=A0A8B3S0T7_9EURY|nr:MAG: hypothetical protein AEth_01326 [Candidatus Argoarchaeum ethanivorans]
MKIMDADIKEICNKIVNDPDLLGDLVKGWVKEHPDISPEEILFYIIKIAGDGLLQEADSDKKRRQKDIARDRAISKVLSNLPDSGDVDVTKKQIKSASFAVSNSSTGYERETLADLLIEYSNSGLSMIKKIRETSDDMGRN